MTIPDLTKIRRLSGSTIEGEDKTRREDHMNVHKTGEGALFHEDCLPAGVPAKLLKEEEVPQGTMCEACFGYLVEEDAEMDEGDKDEGVSG